MGKSTISMILWPMFNSKLYQTVKLPEDITTHQKFYQATSNQTWLWRTPELKGHQPKHWKLWNYCWGIVQPVSFPGWVIWIDYCWLARRKIPNWPYLYLFILISGWFCIAM